MSVFKRTASGAMVAGAGFFVAVAASFWATRYLFRGLGSDTYAVLGLFQGVQGGLLLLLSSVGQNAIMVLLAQGDEAEIRRRSRGMAAWTVVAAFGALIAGWVLALPGFCTLFWKDAYAAELWRVAAPSAGTAWALQILCQALWSAQRARLRMAQAEMQQSLGQVLPVLAGPLALYLGQGLVGVIQYQAMAWLFMIVVGLVWERLIKGGLDLLPREDRPVWAQARGIAGWSAVAMGSAAVLQYGDRFFSLQAGPSELSAYSVATSLTLRVVGFLGILGPLVVPSLSGASVERRAAVQSVYLRVTALLAGAAFLPLAAGGAALLGAWVAPEVEMRSQAWMALLATGALALALSNAYFAVLLGLDQSRHAAYAAVLGLAVGLGAGFTASALGAPAAAWMCLAGNAAMVLARGYALARHGLGRSGWGWLGQILPWLAACLLLSWLLALTGFPRWFGPGLLAQAPAFVLCGCALLAGGLLIDDWHSRRRGRLSVLGQARRLLPGAQA